MRTALLAAAAVLTLGSTALASGPQAKPLLQSDACIARMPRLLHTALSPRPATDCCPATTRCAGYLGMTESPRRPARLKG